MYALNNYSLVEEYAYLHTHWNIWNAKVVRTVIKYAKL